MKCPYCKADRDRVVDSRSSKEGFVVRRRRECLECGRRYTTYERLEGTLLHVIKKDGSRETFDRDKILSGCLKACEKQPVSMKSLETMVDKLEADLLENYDKEVPSKVIGEKVMQVIQQLSQVAYVRFASVYREFKDVNEFMSELKTMMEHKIPNTPGGQS